MDEMFKLDNVFEGFTGKREFAPFFLCETNSGELKVTKVMPGWIG